MTKLGELFTDFSRIDLDARGGYARVAEVKTVEQPGNTSVQRAFKLMRHEIDYEKGMERFEGELRLLRVISQDSKAPAPVTKLYDSGFSSVELSSAFHHRDVPDPRQQIYPTGTEVDEFLSTGRELQKKDPGRWLPYLVVELASYNDSLLRQIQHQPQDDVAGLYRLPTGEVITMALQLLDVIEYLHRYHNRAYMDWKPEHLYWSGSKKKVKLIDWNVTTSLDDGHGKRQNIRDDIRLFCGAALYISLTFIDPDDPIKRIGPRPTTELTSPVPEIRRRYWTDRPNFYQRGNLLDDRIKEIIRKGLDPTQGYESPQELKQTLVEYAQNELGVPETDLSTNTSESEYFAALSEIRLAQEQLLKAQQHLIEATEINGEKIEFTRMFDAIKNALRNFPLS
jgi:serine/threonine protein kinase